MKDYIIKEILKEFIDGVTIEELNHLKFTMSLQEIDGFIQEWVFEHAKKFVKNEITPSNTLSNTIPMKKTFYLKLTVEKEEMSIE